MSFRVPFKGADRSILPTQNRVPPACNPSQENSLQNLAVYPKFRLTGRSFNDIIALAFFGVRSPETKHRRACWNWQTGTFEGRVLHDVRVQVPLLAPSSSRTLYRSRRLFFSEKSSAHSRRRSSSPQKVTCAFAVRLRRFEQTWRARNASACYQLFAGAPAA